MDYTGRSRSPASHVMMRLSGEITDLRESRLLVLIAASLVFPP
jgi:hypothetical protein